MIEENDKVERRKHRRFLAPQDVFVITSDEAVIGEIADISAGGLSFSYRTSRGKPSIAFDLHIFVKDGSFHLFDIPCSLAWDREIGKYHPLSDVSWRECGVQFGAMTPEQKSKLQHFIDNYTRRYSP